MFLDSQTNFLYLSDRLRKRFPAFAKRFECALQEHAVSFAFLPHTSDIWARDYMPVQTDDWEFVQFTYDPDYLSTEAWRKTITDVDRVVSAIGIKARKSSIKLDGGNLICHANKAVICQKVFKENSTMAKQQLKEELQALLKLEETIFIPQQPYDSIGHADGMVRFVDETTVIVNDYTRESKTFQKAFHTPLLKAGLKVIHLPYNPYGNANYLDATGTYINYLQLGDIIFLPVFGLKEDAHALQTMRNTFPQSTLVPIHSNEVAKEGGVLHCISWNICRELNKSSYKRAG